MIDTGTGGQLGPGTGLMTGALAAAGIKPGDVDIILVSHFHADHINGIRDKDGRKVFPNAEITVSAAEWAYWMDEARLNAAPQTARTAFLNARRIFADIAGQVRRFEPGREVAPGIVSIATFGHTPGHTAYAVASGNQSIAGARRRHQPSLVVRAPSALAGRFRCRWRYGGRYTAENARPRRRRPPASAGLSLPVPGLQSHRQDREWLRGRASDGAAAIARFNLCCHRRACPTAVRFNFCGQGAWRGFFCVLIVRQRSGNGRGPTPCGIRIQYFIRS